MTNNGTFIKFRMVGLTSSTLRHALIGVFSVDDLCLLFIASCVVDWVLRSSGQDGATRVTPVLVITADTTLCRIEKQMAFLCNDQLGIRLLTHGASLSHELQSSHAK